MGERPTIAFRVDETQKQKWESAVDDSDEYDSLSHLIRLSVSRELGDAYGTGSAETTSGNRDSLGDIESLLTRLDGKIDGLTEIVESVESTVMANTAVSDATVTSVYSELPTSLHTAVTPQEIAEQVNVSKQEASIALAQISQSNAVNMIPDEDEPRYWREG
ncbi:hypothetical protein [Haloplanus halophilus]|uniref:hypothetical protein n=1 Tax=Haloplanus halophilus TaxID=2949993 RepID=UPI00203F9285|nr:hypothetical protein [Haloplanus sp. GDY1]